MAYFLYIDAMFQHLSVQSAEAETSMGSDVCHATSLTSSKCPRSAPRRLHLRYSACSLAGAADDGDARAEGDAEPSLVRAGELGAAGLAGPGESGALKLVSLDASALRVEGDFC